MTVAISIPELLLSDPQRYINLIAGWPTLEAGTPMTRHEVASMTQDEWYKHRSTAKSSVLNELLEAETKAKTLTKQVEKALQTLREEEQ